MSTGLWVLAVVLVAASAFGLWRRLTDGRITGVSPSVPHDPADSSDRLTADDLGVPLGERATIVQFSTAFCQPCRAARRVISEVTGVVEGVTHADIDAESRLDLVRRLDVIRTPTILVLDHSGRVVKRATGAPRKADVIAALGEVVT